MKRKEAPKQRGHNRAGWRAPELQVQISVLLLETISAGGQGGGKFSNYTNWLPLILLSCRFKTETEALEGFSAIALQATAVAPVTRVSQLSTLCRHLKKKNKPLSVYIIQA